MNTNLPQNSLPLNADLKTTFKKNVLYATLLVTLSGILYGTLGFLGTQLLKANFSVPNMLFWRFFIATIWMLLYGAFKQKKFFAKFGDLRYCTVAFLVGGFFYSGSSFYFIASQEIGTGLAMVIFFAYPMFIALYSWMKDIRTINIFSIFSLLTILFGLVLLKGDESHSISFMGICWALLAALFYAIYVLSGKSFLKKISAINFTTLVCLSCSFLFIISSISTHSFVVPHTANLWIYAISLGVFATAIPIQLMLEGLKIISPLKASIISVLEPVVTLLVGVMCLQEPLTFFQGIGVVIVIVGAIVIQFARE